MTLLQELENAYQMRDSFPKDDPRWSLWNDTVTQLETESHRLEEDDRYRARSWN